MYLTEYTEFSKKAMKIITLEWEKLIKSLDVEYGSNISSQIANLKKDWIYCKKEVNKYHCKGKDGLKRWRCLLQELNKKNGRKPNSTKIRSSEQHFPVDNKLHKSFPMDKWWQEIFSLLQENKFIHVVDHCGIDQCIASKMCGQHVMNEKTKQKYRKYDWHLNFQSKDPYGYPKKSKMHWICGLFRTCIGSHTSTKQQRELYITSTKNSFKRHIIFSILHIKDYSILILKIIYII